MQDKMECESFSDDSKTFNFKIRNKTSIYNQKVATKIIVFSTLETKSEKSTIECIQNEKKSQNTGINKLSWRFNYV